MLKKKRKRLYNFDTDEIKPLKTAIGLGVTAVGLVAIGKALKHI